MLLDLDLPKVAGLELLRRIRSDAATRSVPVVVLTSSKDESDLVKAYELSANSFVRKPVDFERFLDAVREIAHYWLALNESPTRRS